MTGAKGSSARWLSSLWALTCAWLIGALIGLGACVGISTFNGGVKHLLSLLAVWTAQVLSTCSRALTDHPVIGVGVLVGGIVGIFWGQRRS
jgi:hypothetical protein